MSWVERLRNSLYRDDATKGVLAVLSDRPLDEKAAVYGELVEIAVEHLCRTPPKEPRSIALVLRWLAREPDAAGLATQLYDAIGEGPVLHVREAFYDYAATVRDPRGIPLLAGGAGRDHWIDAVLALRAKAHLDEVVTALRKSPSRDLAVAAGYIGGEDARPYLSPSGAVAPEDVRPLGLAFLATYDDKAHFDALGRTPNETTAKRIWTLLSARGPKQKLTALTELAPGIAKATDVVGAERLLAITLALADKRADLVEGAAVALAEYTKRAGARVRPFFYAPFVEQASAAIERGVTEAAREALDAVRATIPNAPAFAAAAIVKKPPSRTEAAKARGAELLEAMRETTYRTTTARNRELEAQLALDPDARDGYLVYADWLQGQGDPRGTWIALHANAKGLAGKAAIEAFLVEHRDAILGATSALLRPPEPAKQPKRTRKPATESESSSGLSGSAGAWTLSSTTFVAELQYGFFKRVVLGPYVEADHVIPFLESTAGAVIQELVFAPFVRDRAIEILLEHRPPALMRVAFGTDDTPPPALVAAMPRLARDPATRWADARARVDAQREVKVEIELAELPALEPRRGIPRPTADDLAIILQGLEHELGFERPLGMVSVVRERFTPASVDAFVEALGQQWALAPDRHRWVFPALGALGGDRTARFLGGRMALLTPMQGVLARSMLIAMGTPTAIAELARLAFDPVLQDDYLRQQLVHAAAQTGSELDAWIGHAVPPDDDHTRAIQRTWLESLMVEGRTFAIADFRTLLGAPLRRRAAETLLWADRDPESGAILGMFRVDDRGRLLRRDGSAYEPTGRIGLVHPAELTDRELVGARGAFAEITQTILQLHRPIFGLAERELASSSLDRFARRRVGFHPIAATLRGRGWTPMAEHVDDDGEDRWVGTRAFARTFERDRATIVATLGDTRGAIAEVELRRREPHPHEAGPFPALHAFGDLHVATISELLWDLETAHGRRADEPYEPAPADDDTPPRDLPRGLVVERAKSGRAKCVVCQTAIPKDSMRIGIERFVETPTFRGTATVWIHPACRDGAPELAGVTVAGLD